MGQLKIIEDIAMRFQELDINISLITITSDGTIGDQTPYYPTDPKSKLAAAAIGSDKISVKDVDDLIPGNGFVLYGGRGRTFYLLSIYEDKYSFYDSTHQELIVYSKEELKKYIEEKKIHLFKQYTTTVLIKDRINKEAEESYSSDNSSNSRSRHY